VASSEKMRGRVIDAHSHIGTMPAWQFYDLKEPVKPTVYEFANAKEYLTHLDGVGVERGLVLPTYGIPVQEHAFSLNDLVLDSVADNDRLVGGCGCRSCRRTRSGRSRPSSTPASTASSR
jgi:hypothetical protein